MAASWLKRARLSRAEPEAWAARRCSNERTSDCTTPWNACLPLGVASCAVHAGVSTSTRSPPASLVQPSVKPLDAGLLALGSVACAAPATIDATRLSTVRALALDLAKVLVERGGFMVRWVSSPILGSIGCASGWANAGFSPRCKPPNDKTPCR